MKHSVELKSELFLLFKQDKAIRELLNITALSTVEEINKKIKRVLGSDDLIDETTPLFFVYAFIPSVSNTKNYKVNQFTLEFRIYGRYQSKIDKLYLAIKDCLYQNYEDMTIFSEGSISTGNQNLYAYMFRTRPLVRS